MARERTGKVSGHDALMPLLQDLLADVVMENLKNEQPNELK